VALEKRVHVTDPGLLPPQALVEYDLPSGWTMRETHSQKLGDEWLDRATEAVLVVPSVVMPISTATDRNVLINHRHNATARISISAITPFTLDPRIFQP
jgi:RES domain-containing protein